LANFDDLTRSFITGSRFNFGSTAGSNLSTVSTGASTPSFSNFLGLAEKGRALSFNEALDDYFKNGGTATTVNDPVMRYDLASMGKHFKEIDKDSGVYMKDGTFFIKEKLGDHEVLQPVGISKDSEGKPKLFGVSTGELSEEQKTFFEDVKTFLEAQEKAGGKPEEILSALTKQLQESSDPGKTLKDLVKAAETTSGASGEAASSPEAPTQAPGSAHPEKQ